jgi:HEAT repeat protein
MSRTTRKLAKAGDVEGLIAVLRAGPEKERAAALDAIFECMETHADRVKELRRSILEACLPMVRDPDHRVRAASVFIAITLRDPSASSVVVGALSDPSPDVRLRAVLGVFHLQPPGCLDDVLRLLRSDEDQHVRAFAAAAIERIGDASSVPALLEARAHEPEPRVREAIDEVVAILEGRHPPTPIEPFMEDPGA